MIKKILTFIVVILLLSYFRCDDRLLTAAEKYTKDIFYTVVYSKNQKIDNNFTNERVSTLEKEINELKGLLELKEISSTFKPINATVIGRSAKDFYELVTIDKGSKDGITEDMAVVTKDGLIGKTINTTSTTSIVKLITSNDVYNKLSVSIDVEGKQVYGILSNYDYKTGSFTVEGIDDMIEIKEGDTVKTTGFSKIYPSGILVGKVTRITRDNFDLSYILKITPLADLKNFNYVAVLNKEE